MQAESRSMMHETHWNPEGVGTASATSHSTPRAWYESEGGRAACRGLIFRGLPMATGGSPGRPWGSEGQTGSGPSAEAARRRTPAASGPLVGRSLGLWFSQRAVDAEADSAGDPQRVRYCIPPQPPMAAVAPRGLVLPGTRAPSDPAERRGHCPLEALQMAAYKKRRNDLGPTWFSSMKAAFCSFRPADGRGGRQGRPLSFITTTGTTVFPPWPPSVSRPSANTWGCISGSSSTTFNRPMWPRLSRHSYDTCLVHSSCCGTMDPSTKDPSSPDCRGTIPDFTLNHSPAMRPNLIQPNKSGMTSRATPPTVCFGISSTSGSNSMTMHGGGVALKRKFNPSSWRPPSRARPGSVCITYAKPYSSHDHAPGIGGSNKQESTHS